MADNNKDYQISEQALNSLNDFKTKMEDVNDSIIDMGDELGDNLVKKLTQVVIEVKKIKNPLIEIESISRKINDIIEETQVLHNQEAIFSRNYIKALQTGNREEQIKPLCVSSRSKRKNDCTPDANGNLVFPQPNCGPNS